MDFWSFIAKFLILTVLSVAFGFFTKIQPIKERVTTSNHSINTIADFRDSQSALTGWSCPEWGGEETSQSFLCKWQKERPGSSKHFMERWILEVRIVPGHVESRSSELVPSSHHPPEEVPGSSPSCPCQVQAGFDSTFSLWD